MMKIGETTHKTKTYKEKKTKFAFLRIVLKKLKFLMMIDLIIIKPN